MPSVTIIFISFLFARFRYYAIFFDPSPCIYDIFPLFLSLLIFAMPPRRRPRAFIFIFDIDAAMLPSPAYDVHDSTMPRPSVAFRRPMRYPAPYLIPRPWFIPLMPFIISLLFHTIGAPAYWPQTHPDYFRHSIFSPSYALLRASYDGSFFFFFFCAQRCVKDARRAQPAFQAARFSLPFSSLRWLIRFARLSTTFSLILPARRSDRHQGLFFHLPCLMSFRYPRLADAHPLSMPVFTPLFPPACHFRHAAMRGACRHASFSFFHHAIHISFYIVIICLFYIIILMRRDIFPLLLQISPSVSFCPQILLMSRCVRHACHHFSAIDFLIC